MGCQIHKKWPTLAAPTPPSNFAGQFSHGAREASENVKLDWSVWKTAHDTENVYGQTDGSDQAVCSTSTGAKKKKRPLTIYIWSAMLHTQTHIHSYVTANYKLITHNGNIGVEFHEKKSCFSSFKPQNFLREIGLMADVLHPHPPLAIFLGYALPVLLYFKI